MSGIPQSRCNLLVTAAIAVAVTALPGTAAKAAPVQKPAAQAHHAANAAPKPAFKIVKGDGFEILSISTDLLYDKDRPSLLPSAAQLLTQISTHLESLGRHPLSVSVHSDALGFESFEERLSKERAETVKSWLVQNQQSLAAADISAAGYGRRKPIALNSNADGTDNPLGRAANRRLEIVVHTAQAASTPVAAGATTTSVAPVASSAQTKPGLSATENVKNQRSEPISPSLTNHPVATPAASPAAGGAAEAKAPPVESAPVAAGQNAGAVGASSVSELGPDFVKLDPSLLEKYMGAADSEPPAGADAGGKDTLEKSFETSSQSQSEPQAGSTSAEKHLGSEKNSFGEHDGDTRRVPAQPTAEDIAKKEKETQWAREEFGLFRDNR